MKIRISAAALGQIDKALTYVAERSPSGAAKIEARLSAILMLLQLQPHAGLTTSLPRIRRIFLTPYPYLIDYSLGASEIVVLRFRHASRNPVSIPGRG